MLLQNVHKFYNYFKDSIMNRMKIVFALFFVGIVFQTNSLKAQTWTKVAGTNGVINRIFASPTDPNIIAATSSQDSLDLELAFPFSNPVSGNGIIISRDGGNSFSERKMDSLLVFDVIKSIHHDNLWYATAFYQDEAGIIVSKDDGITWNRSDMKASSYSSQKFAIQESPFDDKYVAATAIGTFSGYNYTTDQFENTESNNSLAIQSRCLSFSTVKEGLVFIGGDAIAADGVHRSNDGGQHWTKYNSGLEHLRILSVLASAHNPATVFCGADTIYDFANQLYMGRGIFVSQDTGRTWRSIGAKNSRVFDIKDHPKYPYFLAAACNSEGVFVSSASGYYWEQQSNGLPTDVEVRSIAIPNIEPQGNGFTCFAGTKGEGIYKSSPLYTSVESNETPQLSISLYPMPCSDKLTINFISPKAQFTSLEIKDILGNTITEVFSGNISDGSATVNLDNLNQLLPNAGTYLLILKTPEQIVSKSFIKIN